MGMMNEMAYLSLCPECRHHGRIVCSNGTESDEFITVYGGLKQLTELLLSGEISENEVQKLTRQIKASGLPYQDDEAEKILEKRGGKRSWLGSVFNSLHRELRSGPAQMEKSAPASEKRILH